MEADEASMTSLSQQSEDDFERNKVIHIQIELGLSLFFNLFSSLEAISNAFPISELLGGYLYVKM